MLGVEWSDEAVGSSIGLGVKFRLFERVETALTSDEFMRAGNSAADIEAVGWLAIRVKMSDGFDFVLTY